MDYARAYARERLEHAERHRIADQAVDGSRHARISVFVGRQLIELGEYLVRSGPKATPPLRT